MRLPEKNLVNIFRIPKVALIPLFMPFQKSFVNNTKI